MYHKQIYVAFISLLILYGEANGRKSKKNKYPPIKDDETSPQPNVVAYSTFGFNDVGSYDGFVPSSPDYSSFLSGANQETTTRLYAPAFPTASDVTGLETSYGSQPFDGQSFNGNEDGEQSSMVQYPQSTVNFFSTPSLDNEQYNKNKGSEELFSPNIDDSNAPVYGTKLNLRGKNHFTNHLLNNSEGNRFSNYPGLNDDTYHSFADTQTTHESAPKPNEQKHNHHKIENHAPSFPTTSFENAVKAATSNTQNNLKFPSVVDFTNIKTIYPTALDNIATTTPTTPNPFIFSDIQTESSYEKPYSNYNKFLKATSAFENIFDTKDNKETAEKNILKPNSYYDTSSSHNNYPSHSKNAGPNIKPTSDYKKKIIKNKPWSSFQNNTNDFKNWKDVSALKGYEYATNSSKMSFKYDYDEHKKPFSNNLDEIIPASSNLANFHFPETDYSKFKNIPKLTEDDDFNEFGFTKDVKPKVKDYSLYKDLFSTVPTTTSFWGNSFKSSDFSFSKNHPKKFPYTDEINEDVVTIPKRPHKPSFSKPPAIKTNEWPFGNQRPYKSNKPLKDWNNEVNNRFKSEEDLLGLRNHDTSHPSYLPTYKPTYENSLQDDNYKDYRYLIEKWRQSYLKSKLKESFRDYEAFATENKPQHLPVPKPYPIEVPHPVIVPVPQPYPVRVPVSKPVAVPVIHELTVPIEKPVPYPVFKKVPYPVEKLVPVPVEKEVAVPVIKPYPVPVPYVRPVFHHTRHPHDDFDSDQRGHFDDDDYMPRPEGSNKKPQYKRRPYGSRNRSRRPSRNTYQERNRRRWPENRRPNTSEHRSRYPHPEEYHQSHYRQRDSEIEDDRSDRYSYCKKTGRC